MAHTDDIPLPPLDGWALILGASSGFGEACARALARAGVDIIGVHLDRRATMPQVERITARDQGARARGVVLQRQRRRRRQAHRSARGGAEALRRARQAATRSACSCTRWRSARCARSFDAATSGDPEADGDDVRRDGAQSRLLGARSLARATCSANQGRIYAMTSTGSQQVWTGYGAVSAAKSALESHIRQLAFELGPRGITANAHLRRRHRHARAEARSPTTRR